jgi:DNA-directed RNA polymerase subunit RPC12/RpoP
MLAIFPHRPNAVTAQKFFFYRSLKGILSLMGCIPKNLFEPDPRAIRGIMSVRKREGKLLLFPEGRCSVDGSYMGINKSTGKLIKMFNAPVIHCHIEGSYLCMPFWRKGIRFGDERVTLTNILTIEDIKHQTAEEINQLLDNKLSGADIVPPASSFRVFPGIKLAEGLENIIYYCPKCRMEFTLKTKGNNIYCTTCGNRGTMEPTGNLIATSGSIIPTTVASWYREQVLYEIDALDKGGKLIEEAVIVRMSLPKKSGLKPCGEGWIYLDKTGWTFKGNLLDKEVTLFFPIESVPAIPFDPNDNFQIYANGNFYAFTPKGDKSSCAKYATIGECAYWRFAQTVQMTRSGGGGFSRGEPS